MTTTRLCVFAAVLGALLATPSVAEAASSDEHAGCSSHSESPSPWLGLGLLCFGAALRRR